MDVQIKQCNDYAMHDFAVRFFFIINPIFTFFRYVLASYNIGSAAHVQFFFFYFPSCSSGFRGRSCGNAHLITLSHRKIHLKLDKDTQFSHR